MKQLLHDIFRVPRARLDELETNMSERTGADNVIREMEETLNAVLHDRLQQLGLSENESASEVRDQLLQTITHNEDSLLATIGISRHDLDDHESVLHSFEKIKQTAFAITTEKEGFFLKLEKAEQILRAHEPLGTLQYLGYHTVDELLKRESIEEVMSALRFTEDEQWMHQTFDAAYSSFTFHDFEKRPIQLRALGPQWSTIAEKFVAKKHHNVSHLKEFGIIFLNPIHQANPGAFLRDFALFFHYFHEIVFYSRLFQHHADTKDFNEKFKSFLRGDVPEKSTVQKGEWLIVQRYLWKLDPNDPRLFLPRVNPESLHWRRGEDDLVTFGKRHPEVGFAFWDDLDWIAGYFGATKSANDFVSFDMEDNTMSAAAHYNNEKTDFFYHQQEAIWNELFRRFIGEERRQQLIMENFDKGSIQL